LKIEPFLIAVFMGLCSCEKAEPVSKLAEARTENKVKPGIESSLAAAQLALAKSHLAANEFEKAIPFLSAATHAASSEEAGKILTETIASHRFNIPSVLLRHPQPVLCFTEDPGNAIFAALGGKHPTVVRWDLRGSPEVTAVLFPADATGISHISLSPDGSHILVHRDATNLLCDAITLKPISNLGEFPANLDPLACQPFTPNGLLMAHPTILENGSYAWNIRDAASGEVLRYESFPPYPRPLSARFESTTLSIELEDGRGIRIPILGQTETFGSPDARQTKAEAPTDTILTDESTIALCLPLPSTTAENIPPALLGAISGYELNSTTQTLSEIPVPNRLAALSTAFPGQLPSTLKLYSADAAVTRRLAAAYPEEFPNIAKAAIAHADIIRKTFATGNSAAILAVIDSAEHGLPLATALFLSLESGNPSWIERAAAKADDMPAALRTLVSSATAAIPDLSSLRLEQDWLGYESPDFSTIFSTAADRKSDALSRLLLPEHPSEVDIESLVEKLLDPQAELDLGRATIADRAMQAATSIASDPEMGLQTLQLSAIARRFGSPPALCLRTDATAYTSIGDFTSAHRTWIDLITNQPEADHLASDYAEAAYTAFETGDARQAMEILNTGLFRFQNDVAFAIRAGWIALLTDHPTEALTYLTHATKLGLPPAEIENTTALIAITHSQLGDPQSAESYLAQLKAISPKWEDAQNIDALPWPESFKATLREIISRPLPETEPAPSPESDPIYTAPHSGELPIPEPPLPSR
jgi:tetratricopeptide (TPR) repeat protein